MRRLAAGVGLIEFPFAGGTDYWRWVDLCEADGADSIWQSDRLIGAGPVLECLSTLAAIAGRTRRVKFGMNVLSAAMRDPVLCAKQCATIDVLSNGRLLPAFGIGGTQSQEWQALGLDFAGRGARADEALEIISRLWAGETLDFSGAHFTLKGVKILPKPAQPDLPMWIGGSSQAAIRRTARFGTGWQGGVEKPAEISSVVKAIAEAARAAGRPIDEDHYGTTLLYRLGVRDSAETERAATALRARFGYDIIDRACVGDAAHILEHIGSYVKAGLSKFVMVPVCIDGDDAIAQTARLLKEVTPKVPKLPV
jgi:probable F420-dependent oxidoreductase